MINAYDKIYLDKSRIAMGRMLDYAVNDLNYDLSTFFDLFCESNISTRFEKGDFTVLVGMSGIELAVEVSNEKKQMILPVKPTIRFERSEEYWIGWAIAYYQWMTSMSFSEINKIVPIDEIKSMYSRYHEMDIHHFVDAMNEKMNNRKKETNLKYKRIQAGISQSELSEISKVPVRTIQQYEQRQKNINKAQTETLIRLSKALCCEVEDLMEKLDSF